MHSHSEDEVATEALASRPHTGAPAAGAAEALPEGARLGNYRITTLLGRGGMGEVYLAEQLEPVHRTVALKLLRDLRLDARHLAWFEVERQLLAQMQHPAIAQIFDAGTTGQGFPYFAMEYIEGSPVTAFCSANGLDLRQRVELLARVCDGVSHAHGKGVVHRDLKPGNILVTRIDGQAQPKIIDFGIATAASHRDGAEEHAGTPAYMSPEQAGLAAYPVDSRSDVYSLGVVLFELLTDLRPPSPGAIGDDAQTQRVTLQPPSVALRGRGGTAVQETAAARRLSPARLLGALRHELDWVVMKAIRRDPGERYQSAAELAQDLRRFLAMQPLQAVPPTRRYLLGKFTRRHRAGLAAASAIAMALVAGLGLSLWALLQAQEQRGIAEARQAELERAAAFQQAMLEEVDVAAMGQGLLDLQRRQLQRAGDDGAALAAFDAAAAQISATDVAREVLDRYLLAHSLAALERDFTTQPQLAADLRRSIARVYLAIGEFAKAEATARTVVDGRTQLFGAADPRTLVAQDDLATALQRQGRLDDARAVLDAALQRTQVRADETDEEREARWALTLSRALVHSDQGELQRAADMQRALLAEMQPLLGAEHDRTLSVRTNLAISLVRLGRAQDARPEFEEVYRVRLALFGAEHDDTVSAMHNVAAIRGATGDYAGALELQRRSLALHRRQLGERHPQTLMDLNNVASTLSGMGELEEALAAFTQAAEGSLAVLGAEHPHSLRTMQNQVATLTRLGRPAEALPLQQQVLEVRDRTLGAEHPDTLKSRDTLAQVLRDLGRTGEARRISEQVLETRMRTLGPSHPDTDAATIVLASIEVDGGRPERARMLLEELLQRQRDVHGDAHHDSVRTAARLYPLLLQAGQPDAAAGLRTALLEPLLARDPDELDGRLRQARDAAREALQRGRSAGDAPANGGHGA